jgi:hypothetical protein
MVSGSVILVTTFAQLRRQHRILVTSVGRDGKGISPRTAARRSRSGLSGRMVSRPYCGGWRQLVVQGHVAGSGDSCGEHVVTDDVEDFRQCPVGEVLLRWVSRPRPSVTYRGLGRYSRVVRVCRASSRGLATVLATAASTWAAQQPNRIKRRADSAHQRPGLQHSSSGPPSRVPRGPVPGYCWSPRTLYNIRPHKRHCGPGCCAVTIVSGLPGGLTRTLPGPRAAAHG